MIICYRERCFDFWAVVIKLHFLEATIQNDDAKDDFCSYEAPFIPLFAMKEAS